MNGYDTKRNEIAQAEMPDRISGYTFKFDEHQSTVGVATVPGIVLEIQTPPALLKRRIYFHFGASAIAGVMFKARIVCYMNRSEVGSIPFRQNGTANTYYSFPSSNQDGIAGHVGSNNTLWYRDAGGATFGQLLPIEINVGCDMIRVLLEEYANGGAGTLTTYLGCLSMRL